MDWALRLGWVDYLLYWVAFLLGCAWTAYLCFNAPMGTPVQDEIGHFIISRGSWQNPALLLQLWGRPVNTLFYMIPSLGGLNVARAFSILAAGLTVLTATKVAQKLGVRMLFLIPVLLWFQPWFGDLSYAVITEVPFSLLLILGVFCWLAHKWKFTGLCIGLLPLVRHEGIFLVAVCGGYMLYKRYWKSTVVSLLPVVVYNLVYLLVFQRCAYRIFLDYKPTGIYGAGGWLHYAPALLNGIGLPTIILSVIGIVPILRLKEKALVLMPYMLYLLVHVVIYRLGLYASGGYGLFLLPLAPAAAIAATLGLEFALNEINNFAHVAAWFKIVQVLATTLCVVLMLWFGLQTRPRATDPEALSAQQASEWIRQNNLFTNRIISTHVWFCYYHSLPLTAEELWVFHPSLDQLEVGTVIVWDRHYSDRWGISYEYLSDPRNGWQRLMQFGDGIMVVFQKTG
jgi:hypothetical protein